MKIHIERLPWEPIVEHHFSAHEGFQWKGCEHIEPEAKTSNVHHGSVNRKIVEDVALCEGAKCKESGKSHKKTCKHGDAGTIVCDTRKAVYCRSLEGPVDE